MIVQPHPRHQVIRDGLIALIHRHSGERADEMLALAAQIVGQLIALQEQAA